MGAAQVSRVFWDTNLFIYLLDRDPVFFERTAALRKRMLERGDELVTSAMTLGEIQVWPRRQGDAARARLYGETIRRLCTVVPFDEAAADRFAAIREDQTIKPPDAIQLSCAAALGVELFITNDQGLLRLTVPGIHFVTTLDRVPI
jgi:predicted nucleic acid-binding protein